MHKWQAAAQPPSIDKIAKRAVMVRSARPPPAFPMCPPTRLSTWPISGKRKDSRKYFKKLTQFDLLPSQSAPPLRLQPGRLYARVQQQQRRLSGFRLRTQPNVGLWYGLQYGTDHQLRQRSGPAQSLLQSLRTTAAAQSAASPPLSTGRIWRRQCLLLLQPTGTAASTHLHLLSQLSGWLLHLLLSLRL